MKPLARLAALETCAAQTRKHATLSASKCAETIRIFPRGWPRNDQPRGKGERREGKDTACPRDVEPRPKAGKVREGETKGRWLRGWGRVC